jgi:uncharacterized repeat protein (TIGR02543 family)
VTNVTLLPLRSGTWTLRVEATVDGVLKGDGTVTVTVKPGATVAAAVNMSYRYNVTFDADGGSELSMTGKDVVYDAPYGVLATATKAGYTLAGWYTERNGGGTQILEDTEVSIVTSQTLYAKWSANTYTVTFDANGGSGSMEAQNFTYGTPANLIANTFTKTGYDFAGWATSASGSKEYDDQDSYPTPATNTTLYAKWSANTYNITYNLNGGTNEANPATYTIETAKITMLAPRGPATHLAGGSPTVISREAQ